VIPKAAQPGIAADRFAREIIAILIHLYCALAAADGQPVGPGPKNAISMQ